MAVTGISEVQKSIAQKYAAKVMRDMLTDTFWDGQIGPEGAGAAITSRTELLNKPGDSIHINITAPLTGAGLAGDGEGEPVDGPPLYAGAAGNKLEGNEEALTSDEMFIYPLYRRHAVRVNSRINKKSELALREEARMRLAEWGRDKLDKVRFDAFVAASNGYGTQVVKRVAGANIDALVAANVLTLAFLTKLKYIARAQGVKPFLVGGNRYYAAVIDQWAEYDLKVTDTNWVAAQKEAQARGGSNPLFTGAGAIWDGVVINVTDRVPTLTNANAIPCRVAKNLFYGKEAFMEAWGSSPSWTERDFDYGNEFGIAYGFEYGAKRTFEKYSLQFQCAAAIQS